MRSHPLRARALVNALAIAALTSTVAGTAAAQRAGEGGLIDPRSGRFRDVFANEPARAPDTLAAPAARVFAMLGDAYASLAVPLSVVDTASHALGAIRVTVRRPLGGQRLSMLLECGTGAYGPNAERYTVQLTMVSAVRAIDSTHSEVETRVEGIASPNGLDTSVRCASTGQLEQMLVDRLRKQLGS